MLTRRGIPLRQKGRVYRSCVQSVMVYASETWAVRVEEEQRMERNENVMLRWMCGVTLRAKVPKVDLRRRLGLGLILILTNFLTIVKSLRTTQCIFYFQSYFITQALRQLLSF